MDERGLGLQGSISVATLTHHILRGSEVLNSLQCGPECTPRDVELLILEECDGSK